MEITGLIEFYDPIYIYELSEKYSIDPGFALATFILETGWGRESKAWLDGYNPAGITCGGAYCRYNNPEQGMEALYKLLKTYTDGSVDYIGKKNTVEQVRSKWSESKDTDDVLEIWRSIYDKGRN